VPGRYRLSRGDDVRTFLTFIGLGCAATILVVSLSETQQNATDTLSSYKRDGPSVLLHDERLKEVTRRNPYMRDER
jgi:hypothetical protein